MPVAGGLYDQDPDLLDKWMIIISEKAKHDRNEREEQDRKLKRNRASSGRSSGRGRRR